MFSNIYVDDITLDASDSDQNNDVVALINQSLQRLMNNTSTRSVIDAVSAFGKKVLITTAPVERSPDPDKDNTEVEKAEAAWAGAYDDNDYSLYRVGSQSPLVSYFNSASTYKGYIYLSNRADGILYDAKNDFNGYNDQTFSSSSSFEMELDRIIFHEFVHLLTTNPDSYGTDDGNLSASDILKGRIYSYTEDIAIIGENFIYAHASQQQPGFGSTDYRQGHGNPVSKLGGTNSMTAFSSFGEDRTISPHGTSGQMYVSFKATSSFQIPVGPDEPNPFSLEMRYYQAAYNPLGSSGSVETLYDHYMVFRAVIPKSTGYALFNLPQGDVTKTYVFDRIASDSMISNPIDAMNVASDALFSVSLIRNPSSSARTHVSSLFGIDTAVQSHSSAHDLTLSLSSQRFTDTKSGSAVDVTGTVKSETQDAPPVFAINALNEATGVNIFGASGFKIPATQTGYSYDANSTSDFLVGSAHDDIIFLGDGHGVAKNYAIGGGGSDLIIGRSGNDDMRGGAGNDIFVGSHGMDIIDGGDGLDIVTFADSSIGISSDGTYAQFRNADGSTPYGMTSISHVEGIIGTSKDDSFTAKRGIFIDGGAGSDRFDMEDGAFVFGGAGGDTFWFYNSVNNPGVQRFVIGDFDPTQDRIMMPMPYGGMNVSTAYDLHTTSWGTIISVFDRTMTGGMFYPGGGPATTTDVLTAQIYAPGWDGTGGQYAGLVDTVSDYMPTIPTNPYDMFGFSPI